MQDEARTSWGRGDLERILFSAKYIERRVAQLGLEIDRATAGRPLLVVAVLTGAAIFAADLLRQIEGPAELDFIAVSSYGKATRSSGEVRLLKDLSQSVEGRHLLLVEDIVDTGLTMAYLRDTLWTRAPASLRLCSLLDKREARQVDIEVDYVGFECPPEFVVGYGLDYAGRYRNLPDIGVLKSEVYA